MFPLCTGGGEGGAQSCGPGWGSTGRVFVPDRLPPSFQADAGARSTKPVGSGATGGPEEAGPGSGAGPVLHFFTRLRRHTSLDGASPYFKVKKWKLDPSQRASSLDTRGERRPWVETRARRVQPQAALHSEVLHRERSLLPRGLGLLPRAGQQHPLATGHLAPGLTAGWAVRSAPVKQGHRQTTAEMGELFLQATRP